MAQLVLYVLQTVGVDGFKKPSQYFAQTYKKKHVEPAKHINGCEALKLKPFWVF